MPGMIILLLLAVFVLLLVALGAWIGLFRLVYKTEGETGVAHVFIHLFVTLIAIGVLYYFTVATDDCTGFLCGLTEGIFFVFFGAVLLAGWPFAVLTYYKEKAKKRK